MATKGKEIIEVEIAGIPDAFLVCGWTAPMTWITTTVRKKIVWRWIAFDRWMTMVTERTDHPATGDLFEETTLLSVHG